MLKIVDNVIPKQVFKDIKNEILSSSFPFYYSSSTAYPEDKLSVDDYSFSHLAYNNNKSTSPIGDRLYYPILSILDTMGILNVSIHRIRIGLLTNVGYTHSHKAHVDNSNPKHYTGLIYLNDSDGDTIIYKNKIESSIDYKALMDNNILLEEEVRVTPKENRLVLMSGDIIHASSSPTIVPARYAINFNFFCL